MSASNPKNPQDAAPRETFRLPFEAQVNIEFEKFSGFITEFSSNISEGGMFINTKEPKPIGTVLSFEFKLRDNFKLIQGLGEVVWVRTEDYPPEKPAGMGIRFHEIDSQSRELIRTMIENHQKSGGKLFELDDRTPQAQVPPKSGDVEKDFAALFAAGEDSPGNPATPAPPVKMPPPAAKKETSRPPAKKMDLVIEDDSVNETRIRPDPIMDSSKFKKADRRGSRRLMFFLVLFLLIAGAGGAGYMYREPLEALLNGSPSPIPIAIVKKKPVLTVPPAIKATPPASIPAEIVAAPKQETPPAIHKPVVAAANPISKPVAPATTSTPATIVENISYTHSGGETIVTLVANGEIASDRRSNMRVEGRSPREVVKISGISQAYPEPKLPVGTEEVRQVRTGYHPEGNGELHIVIDLAKSSARLGRIDSDGQKLQIHISQP